MIYKFIIHVLKKKKKHTWLYKQNYASHISNEDSNLLKSIQYLL